MGHDEHLTKQNRVKQVGKYPSASKYDEVLKLVLSGCMWAESWSNEYCLVFRVVKKALKIPASMFH